MIATVCYHTGAIIFLLEGIIIFGSNFFCYKKVLPALSFEIFTATVIQNHGVLFVSKLYLIDGSIFSKWFMLLLAKN